MLRKIMSTLGGLGFAGALALTLGLGAATASAAPAASPQSATLVQAPAAGKAEARIGHALARALVRTTAELTGAELRDVREALRDGQSLAEFAAANGSSGDAVVQAVVEKARTRLDKAVENGRLTRERADALLQRLSERATDLVNRKRGA